MFRREALNIGSKVFNGPVKNWGPTFFWISGLAIAHAAVSNEERKLSNIQSNLVTPTSSKKA